MNAVWMLAAVAVAGLAARYLPHAGAGVAAFAGVALLLLVLAWRARRQARAHARDDAYLRAYGTPAPTPEAAQGRAGGRARMWLRVGAGVGVSLGALVWALGVWVLWATGTSVLLVIFVLTYFRHTRRRVAEVSVTSLSTPPDSGSWLAELPGRVADAVDAARLVRGHADAADARAAEAGEGAA